MIPHMLCTAEEMPREFIHRNKHEKVLVRLYRSAIPQT